MTIARTARTSTEVLLTPTDTAARAARVSVEILVSDSSSADATVTPAALAATVTIPTPGVSVTGSAIRAPDALVATVTIPTPSTSTPTVPPSPFALTDFAGLYDARNIVGTAGADVTTWADESGNGRDMTVPANADAAPVISDSYYGGLRSVLANYVPVNIQGLEYDEGSEFYTGDVGIIFVIHVLSFVDAQGSGDAYLTAPTDGASSTYKHLFGYVPDATTGDGDKFVGLHNPSSAHFYFGTAATSTAYVLTAYMHNSTGNVDYYINGVYDSTSTTGIDTNNYRGWRLFSRESANMPSAIAVGWLGLIEMDGWAEADLLAATDEIGAEFGVLSAQTIQPPWNQRQRRSTLVRM